MIPPRSVRARLTLWYSGVLAIVLVAFSAISYVSLARHIRTVTDHSLAETAREFVAAFAHPGPERFPEATEPLRLDFRYSDRAILVFHSDGRLLVGSAGARIAPAAQSLLNKFVHSRRSGYFTASGAGDNDGVRVFVTRFDAVGKEYAVAIIRSLREQSETLEFARYAMWFGIPLALVTAAGGGYLLARKSLGPMMAMTRQAREISADSLGERVAVNNPDDELGFLGTTLNQLFARLETAFSMQRRFMADASHELRTPLAILQGETDVVLKRDRSPADYRQTLEVMQRTIRKLSSIVNDLFLLSRSDSGGYPVRKKRFYLEELVADSVESFRSLALRRQLHLDLNMDGEAIVNADEELVARLVSNLLDNAIKYTPAGGRVEVLLERHGSEHWLLVLDSGAGIPAEARSQIFERFFRVDQAKTAASNASPHATGAGLGLPIARWIAEAHGGRVWLQSSGERGSVFVAAFPAEASPAG